MKNQIVLENHHGITYEEAITQIGELIDNITYLSQEKKQEIDVLNDIVENHKQ